MRTTAAGERRSPRGFSLIELLIVVAIILIIAAIAVPNFMRSRMAANESAAVTYLRAINTASVAYSSTYGNGYPPDLATLGPPPGGGGGPTCDSADLIDALLAAGQKSGYIFTYTAGAAIGGAAAGCTNPGLIAYSVNANPLTPGATGQRYFFSDESNVIRFNVQQQAGVADQPID
ncbi:MAG: prepilin-type N-terminal cleavage/methylation domain-containing protein [Terriglobia bacterium]